MYSHLIIEFILFNLIYNVYENSAENNQDILFRTKRHTGTLSIPSNKEKDLIVNVIGQWEHDSALQTERQSSLFTARGRVGKNFVVVRMDIQDSNEKHPVFSYRNGKKITSGFAQFDRYAIQRDGLTFAVIHVQHGINFGRQLIQRAFRQSLNTRAHIFLTATDVEINKPDDGNTYTSRIITITGVPSSSDVPSSSGGASTSKGQIKIWGVANALDHMVKECKGIMHCGGSIHDELGRWEYDSALQIGPRPSLYTASGIVEGKMVVLRIDSLDSDEKQPLITYAKNNRGDTIKVLNDPALFDRYAILSGAITYAVIHVQHGINFGRQLIQNAFHQSLDTRSQIFLTATDVEINNPDDGNIYTQRTMLIPDVPNSSDGASTSKRQIKIWGILNALDHIVKECIGIMLISSIIPHDEL